LKMRLKNLFHYIITYIFFRPFFKERGNKIIICNPILITPRCLHVGSKVFIRDFARLEGVHHYAGVLFNPSIIIGNNVSIEQNLHLTCANEVSIGDNTAIAANVTITDINHPYVDVETPPEQQPISFSAVQIGRDCKIYNNVVILPGTKLGNHNIVGANSVVSGSYPDYCVIAGVPAKILKRYDFKRGEWLKN